jgi:hypothetical protein
MVLQKGIGARALLERGKVTLWWTSRGSERGELRRNTQVIEDAADDDRRGDR